MWSLVHMHTYISVMGLFCKTIWWLSLHMWTGESYTLDSTQEICFLWFCLCRCAAWCCNTQHLIRFTGSTEIQWTITALVKQISAKWSTTHNANLCIWKCCAHKQRHCTMHLPVQRSGIQEWYMWKAIRPSTLLFWLCLGRPPTQTPLQLIPGDADELQAQMWYVIPLGRSGSAL